MTKQAKVDKDIITYRIIIENVSPEIDGGAFPIKRVVGEKDVVRADVFADGHDAVEAYLLYREFDQREWQEEPMKSLGNDAWIGSFVIKHEKNYFYSVCGRVASAMS